MDVKSMDPDTENKGLPPIKGNSTWLLNLNFIMIRYKCHRQ